MAVGFCKKQVNSTSLELLLAALLHGIGVEETYFPYVFFAVLHFAYLSDSSVHFFL
jgi:hypothetical protein